MTSGGNVVLKDLESVSSKEWIDPGMIELRAKLLLKRDLGGASSQGVRSELKGNNGMLKEGAGPLPVAKRRFIVGSDAAAGRVVDICVCGTSRDRRGRGCCCQCSRRGGVGGNEGIRRWAENEVVDEVEVDAATGETGSTSACGKGAKKKKAAKLTFQKDQET